MNYILITGSAGFLGKKVTLNLLKNNYRVIGVDIKESNIVHPHFEEHMTDIRELKIDKTIHTIIHLASVMNPPRG